MITTTPNELNEFLESINQDWQEIDYSNAEVACVKMSGIIGKMQGKLTSLAIESEVYNKINNK